MTQAYWAYGTAITRAGNPIGQIRTITGPDPEMETIDVSALDGPGWREFVGGIKNGGQVTLEGDFYPGDATGQIGLQTDFANQTLQAFVMTFPAAMAASLSFSALVIRPLGLGAPVDGAVPFTAVLQISGAVTLNLTASAGLTALAGTEETLAAVLDLVPNFLAATLAYSCIVDTASTWVEITVTAAAHTITVVCGATTVSGASPLVSGHMPIGAANSLTQITITAQEANHIAQITTIDIARP